MPLSKKGFSPEKSENISRCSLKCISVNIVLVSFPFILPSSLLLSITGYHCRFPRKYTRPIARDRNRENSGHFDYFSFLIVGRSLENKCIWKIHSGILRGLGGPEPSSFAEYKMSPFSKCVFFISATAPVRRHNYHRRIIFSVRNDWQCNKQSKTQNNENNVYHIVSSNQYSSQRRIHV